MLNNKKSNFDNNARSTHSRLDKQKIFSEWKTSGLSKSEFCKKKILKLSVFSSWCRELSSNQSKLLLKKNSIFSVLKNIDKEPKAPVLIEITLPSGMIFSTSFKLTSFLSFLKDMICIMTKQSSK